MKRLMILAAVALATPFITSAEDFSFTYRGRIDPAGAAMPEVLTVGFSLYAEQAGGEAVWTGTSTVRPAANGLFQCELAGDGLAAAITNSNARFIGVRIEGGYEQFPRQEMLAAPLASFAQKAGALAPGGAVGRIEAAQIGAQSVAFAPLTVSGGLTVEDSAETLAFDKVGGTAGGTLELRSAGGVRVFREGFPLSREFEKVTEYTVLVSSGENATGGAVVLMSRYMRDWGYGDGSACITWVVGPGSVYAPYSCGHPVNVYFYPFGTSN